MRVLPHLEEDDGADERVLDGAGEEEWRRVPDERAQDIGGDATVGLAVVRTAAAAAAAAARRPAVPMARVQGAVLGPWNTHPNRNTFLATKINIVDIKT